MAKKQDLFDRFIKILRITGCLVGLVNIALGIYELVTSNLNPRTAINAVYSILFGIFMVIAEARWVQILKHFYFLQHFLGLGAFYLFVGGLALGGASYQYAVAAACIGIGLIYFTLGLGCRRMGHENFKQLGFRTGSKSIEGGVGTPPTKAAGDQPLPPPPPPPNEGQSGYSSGYASSGSSYDNHYSGQGDEPQNYQEPAAITEARKSAYEH